MIQFSSPKVANRDRLNAEYAELMKKAVITAQDMMKKSIDDYKRRVSPLIFFIYFIYTVFANAYF